MAKRIFSTVAVTTNTLTPSTFNDTMDYRLDKNLYPIRMLNDLNLLLERGIMLCGGSALSLYLGQRLDAIKDFDFYCRDLESRKTFEEYLTKIMRLNLHHTTDNALTYVANWHPTRVQIIIRNYYSDYQAVFADFDFGICKVAYDGENYHFGPNTLEQIVKRKLVLEGKASNDFVKRWFKYTLKGYKMDNQTAADIIKSVPEISFDLSNDTGY